MKRFTAFILAAAVLLGACGGWSEYDQPRRTPAPIDCTVADCSSYYFQQG